MNKSEQISRRDALTAGKALLGFSFLPSTVLGMGDGIAPNDRVNIAYVGIGGQYGARAFQELAGHNVVALCEVDWRQLPNRPSAALQAVAKYPEAKRFDDWRIMLQEMDKKIDAVVVCTTDHMHAHPAIAAMKMGKHVLCEKPLAHSVGEVKAMMAAERKYKVSTQMGIQGHASDDVRSMVEWIRDGAIGTVKEVHLFDGARQTPPGGGASGRGGRGAYDNIQRVDGQIAIHLFRVLQEALNNVARHSKSTHAAVRLRYLPDAVVLEVEDEGVGFGKTFGNAGERHGMGLVSMRERAGLVNGRLELLERSGGGALVRLTVPLSPEEARVEA
jgi:predicted dehydrogenase